MSIFRKLWESSTTVSKTPSKDIRGITVDDWFAEGMTDSGWSDWTLPPPIRRPPDENWMWCESDKCERGDLVTYPENLPGWEIEGSPRCYCLALGVIMLKDDPYMKFVELLSDQGQVVFCSEMYVEKVDEMEAP